MGVRSGEGQANHRCSVCCITKHGHCAIKIWLPALTSSETGQCFGIVIILHLYVQYAHNIYVKVVFIVIRSLCT